MAVIVNGRGFVVLMDVPQNEAGTVKEGKSTVAALLYSLLGDYGVEPALRGQSARDVRRIAEGDPEVMVKKARAVPQRADQVTIRERQLPRKG